MTDSKKLRLGDRLIEKGKLTIEQLELALAEQRRAHRPIGEILMSIGFVNEDEIVELIAEDLGLEFLRASDVDPDPELMRGLTESFVRESLAFPYALDGGVLKLLMVHPEQPARISRVREHFPYPLDIAITTERDVQLLLHANLRSESSQVAQIFAEIRDALDLDSEQLPIERLTRALLVDAIHRGASDIHIEPEEQVTRVRYRVDGILQAAESLPAEATAAVISRIKVLSRLDISERRRPQEGRFRSEIDGYDVDFRVAISPSPFGENAVLRVLAGGIETLGLHQLGISTEHQSLLTSVSQRSHGLFLITGPTGAGKTTTLYSVLEKVDGMRRKIATIEDPIEICLPLVRQSQVDLSVGFDFQRGLRALLRQDPDVILIGEIRDSETADMAIRAAMTGHLVFSTLHANSAIGAIPRLLDLGIDRFLLDDILIGTMGQRLVRTLCEACRESKQPEPEEIAWLGQTPSELWREVGCTYCSDTGYAGRTAIAELFLPEVESGSCVQAAGDPAELESHGPSAGFYSMKAESRRAVLGGRTTIAEIERVNTPVRLRESERLS